MEIKEFLKNNEFIAVLKRNDVDVAMFRNMITNEFVFLNNKNYSKLDFLTEKSLKQKYNKKPNGIVYLKYSKQALEHKNELEDLIVDISQFPKHMLISVFNENPNIATEQMKKFQYFFLRHVS